MAYVDRRAASRVERSGAIEKAVFGVRFAVVGTSERSVSHARLALLLFAHTVFANLTDARVCAL